MNQKPQTSSPVPNPIRWPSTWFALGLASLNSPGLAARLWREELQRLNPGRFL